MHFCECILCICFHYCPSLFIVSAQLLSLVHSPTLAVPNYKALYNYKPVNDGDLELAIGDWVTLRETPLGGSWWRGSVEGKGEGWFPKNYVKFVDVEAEKKKREAGKRELIEDSGVAII